MLRCIILGLLFGLPVCAGAQTFTPLYNWQVSDHDWNPNGDLLVENGPIFGTIEFNATSFENPNDTGCGGYGCGSVFRLSGGAQTTLHAFAGADGGMPIAGLIRSGGKLYGTTAYGGPNCAVIAEHCGTVFSLDPETGLLATLHGFSGLADGGGSTAKLLLYKGMLYGTTSVGGLPAECGGQGCGTIFRIDPTSGAFSTLHEFSAADGTGAPETALTRVGPELYGTTTGFADYGTVFRIDPASAALTILHRFGAGTDGRTPSCALVASGNMLYGTTSGGGSSAFGALFKIDANTGRESIVSSFAGDLDGYYPGGPIAIASGTLYGAVPYTYIPFFPIYPAGYIYQLDLATGIRTGIVSFSFTGTTIDAQTPLGVAYRNGLLYGVTREGGNAYSIGYNEFVTLGVAYSLAP